jgi:hypothetical protein
VLLWELKRTNKAKNERSDSANSLRPCVLPKGANQSAARNIKNVRVSGAKNAPALIF